MKVKNEVKEKHEAGLEALPILRGSELASPLLPVIKIVLDNMSESVILQDTNHRMLWVNRAAAEAQGMTPEEMVGRLCYEVIHQRQKPCVDCPLTKACKTGKPQVGEGTTPDGRVWLKRISPVRDDKGKVIGAVETISEITERKEVEEALKRSEKNLRAIMDTVQAGIVTIDKKTHEITYANPAALKMIGGGEKEVVGEVCHEFLCPAEKGKCPVTDLGQTLDKSERILGTVDGDVIPVLKSVTPIALNGRELLLESFIDISELKHIEKALRESEQKYSTFVEKSNDGIVVIQDGSIVFANTGMLKLLGLSLDEVLGKSLVDFTSPDYRPLMVGIDKRKMAGEEAPDRYESEIVAKDGRKVVVGVNVSAIEYKGRPADMVILHDVTQRKRMEEEIRSSEERLRIMFESAPDAYFLSDTKGTFIDANKAAELLTGYKKEELIGKSFLKSKLLPLKQLPKVAKLFTQNDLGQPTSSDEFSLIRKDGKQVIVEVKTHPVKLQGQTTVLAVARDITERRQAEEALRQAEEKYRNVVQEAVDGIFQSTPEGRFIMVNRALARIHGYESPEELMNAISNVRELYVEPEDRAKFVNLLKESGKVETFEAQFYRKDGSKIWVSLKARAVHDSNGAVLYYEGMVRDITQHKEAGTRLKKLYSMQTIEKDIAHSLLRARSELELFQQFCNLLVKLEFIRFVWIGIADREMRELKPVAHAGFEDGYLSIIKVAWDDSGRGNGPVGEAVLTGQAVVTPDIENDPKYKRWIEEALKRGYLSRVVLPIVHEGEAIGVLSVYSGTKGAFGDDEIEFLTRVADNVAVGVKTLRLQKELERSLERARSMLEGTIEAVVAVSEIRDPYTAGHQRRVAKLASAIAEELGLPEDQIESIRVAGLLHDIGKVYVPAEILSKPGRLNEIEMNLVKTHSQASVDILKTVHFPWSICIFVLQHHERMDGSGYPKGLTGDYISLEAKILGVADVIEAMASHRPYRPALGIDKALDEILRNKGVLYDPEVVDACLRLFTKKEFKFEQK